MTEMIVRAWPTALVMLLGLGIVWAYVRQRRPGQFVPFMTRYTIRDGGVEDVRERKGGKL